MLVATTYLRELNNPGQLRTFSIIVEPLVGRITNVRNFGDHYAIILSGSEDIPTDVVRHAFLHFLLDPLPLMYPHIIAVKRPVYEIAAKAPRLAADLRDDFPSWFAECTVRAVELKLKRMSPSEREVALNTNDADGYVLVRPIFKGLSDYEKNEPSMRNYFPEMVRNMDLKAEVARAAALTFAPQASAAQSVQLSTENLNRKRRATPATLPDDPGTIAQLTGNLRMANASLPTAIPEPPKPLSKMSWLNIPTRFARGTASGW